MRAVSRGYLSLTDADVRIDPWNISLGDAPSQSSPDELRDWSYYQSIKVKVSVVADLEALFAKLKLGDGASLGALVVWTSPGTSLRGASSVFPAGTSETSVEFELDGGLLRGDLRLECQMVLTQSSHYVVSALAPSEPGSIVWSTGYSLRLEGTGARMPVLAVPFSNHLGDGGNHGLWWLQVDSVDLYAPADSALWMWLNDENPIIQNLLSHPESDGALAVQALLKLDFYRQLVELGLRDTDFVLEDEYPTATLGAVIADPIRLLGQNLSELRSMFVNDPSRLEAEIQARLGGL